MRERTKSTLQRIMMYSFEALVAFLLLLEAISFVSGAPQPGSIEHAFPHWLRFGWGLILLFGATFVLLGLGAGRRFLHAAGMWLISGVALFYSIAVVSAHLKGYQVQALSDIGLSGAAAARAVQLQSKS